MPVTEVAILPLHPGVDPSDETSFLAKLRHTKQVMENALGVPGRRFVYYYHQGVESDVNDHVDDTRTLYLLGDWQSAAEHRDEFLPSPANQAQLALVEDIFDLPRVDMFHVDVPAGQVPTDAEVLSIGRLRVRAGDKVAFEERFGSECKPWLDRYVSREKKPAGGWRIEKATASTTTATPGREKMEEDDEWVLFCGWESVEEHMKFAGTEGFERHGRIRELVQGFEVKHGKRIAL